LDLEKKPMMTPQRKVILEALRTVDSHPSADKVYEMVRKRLPRISLGTVYRNLEMLSELGEIQKLEFSGTLKRFDGNPTEHYHIRCICCDCIADAPFPPLTSIDREADGATGYRILGHRLEFIGLCPECAGNPISPGLRKMRKNTWNL